jgi:hypothetical protein
MNIDQFNHTTDWLSTSPFHQGCFRICTGRAFRFKGQYDGFQRSQTAKRHQARRSSLSRVAASNRCFGVRAGTPPTVA